MPTNEVFTTARLRQLGVSRHGIDTLLRRGVLHHADKGVYTSGPPEGRLLLAAVSARRPNLTFAGRTAFQLHSGQEITTPVTARVPHGRSTTGSALLTVRQSRVLYYGEIGGVKVVSPVAAVADLLEWNEGELASFLELQYSGREGRPRLERHLALLGRVPRKLQRIIRRASIGADSESERRVFRALKRRGVKVLQNQLIGPYFWDGVIPGAKIAIEIDSYRYHGLGPNGENHQTFVRDRWKANHAVREGYRVLRFTGECVYHHLDAVINEIMAEVENAPARGTPVWKWHSAWLFPEMMADGWDD